MEEKETNLIEVPYIVYEGTMARMERTIKRLFILLMVTIGVIFVSNAIWLYWWNQYDYTTEANSYEQDGSGLNLIGDKNHIMDFSYGTETEDIQEDSEEKE